MHGPRLPLELRQYQRSTRVGSIDVDPNLIALGHLSEGRKIVKTAKVGGAVIEQYTRLRKTGKNFVGRCPIHQEKHPSLMVYPDQQKFHCYGCNWHGDVIDFIMAVEDVDFRHAVGVLNGT